MEQVAKKEDTCFHLISEDIVSISQLVPSGDEVMKDELKQAVMNARFMRLFCSCLAYWDFTFTSDDDDDVQTMGRLIIALKDIWVMDKDKGLRILNQQKLILNHMRKDTDVKYFHTEKYQIEEDIHRSKQMMEEGCGNLLRCSVMRCKPLAYSEIRQFLRLVYECLDEFLNCGDADIVKLEKQIGIFKDMIYFLCESLDNNINCIEFMNFVGVFSLKAACLACLYWAKEADEEAATEMNSLLFDMIHEFIPYAPDVSASYFRILRSTEPIILDSFVAKFVTFFFQHLSTTIPNDDFLIFRDQMIGHFTFLAYDVHENAKELSDYKSMIETIFAKARLHYYGFSDSWIGLEAAKMVYVSFHPVQRELYFFGNHYECIPLNMFELIFLRTFLLWLATCDDSVEETRLRLQSIIVNLQGIWGKEEEIKGFLVARLSVMPKGDITDCFFQKITDWNPIRELHGKIELSKLEIETWVVNWFHCSLPSKPSTSNKIKKFMGSILICLNGLVDCRSDEIIVSFKKEIETLKEKLIFLHDLLKVSENCTDTKELGEFNMLVQEDHTYHA